jgi:hypothetical protein
MDFLSPKRFSMPRPTDRPSGTSVVLAKRMPEVSFCVDTRRRAATPLRRPGITAKTVFTHRRRTRTRRLRACPALTGRVRTAATNNKTARPGADRCSASRPDHVRPRNYADSCDGVRATDFRLAAGKAAAARRERERGQAAEIDVKAVGKLYIKIRILTPSGILSCHSCYLTPIV